jgi:hypothetical protein
MKEHPEFSDSINKGRDEYDSQVAEKALNKRIQGYRYTQTTQEEVPVRDENGKIISHEMRTVKKVRKYMQPSDTAIIFHLKNRRPERWSDTQKVEIPGLEQMAESLRKANERLAGRSIRPKR